MNMVMKWMTSMKKKEELALVKALIASVIPFTSGIGMFSKETPSEYEKTVISAFLKLYERTGYTPVSDCEHNIIADCYTVLRNN